MVSLKNIIVLFILTMFISVFLQMITFFAVASVCEYLGIETENSVCHMYFNTEDHDTSKIDRYVHRTKGHERRWCLVWRNRRDRGLRCFQAVRFFHWLSHDYYGMGEVKQTETKASKAAAAISKQETTTIRTHHEISSPNISKFPTLATALRLVNGSIEPKAWIKRSKGEVQLVITLALTRRISKMKDKFLTLDSLFQNLRPQDHHKCLVLVFITAIFDEKLITNLAEQLINRYDVQIDTGLLEVIVPNEKFYNILFIQKTNGRLGFNSKTAASGMRKKGCLDHILMMLFAEKRGMYYLQLNDQTLVKPGFFETINEALSSNKPPWFAMSFAHEAMMGKLVRTQHLMSVASSMSRLNNTADFYLTSFVRSQGCPDTDPDKSEESCDKKLKDLMPQITPVVFKTYNVSDSGDNKSNKGHSASTSRGKELATPKLMSQTVAGYLPCSSLHFADDLLRVLVPGGWPVRVVEPLPGGRIDILFKPAISLKGLELKTGLGGNTSTVLGEDTSVFIFSVDLQKYKFIGNLSTGGGLKARITTDFHRVQVITIQFGQKHKLENVYIDKLTTTVACHVETRVHLSTTASLTHQASPVWYKPDKGNMSLPRRENGILISY